jgi:glycosyltransferase involved in cell wall biosynthesis
MTGKWTINGRFLAQPLSGVQRYAHEVVRALDAIVAEQLHPDLEIEIVAPADAELSIPLAAICVRKVAGAGGHAWEQAVLPCHAAGGLVSLCNTGPLLHRRQIVCIHDANTRNFPQSYSMRFRLLYRMLLPSLGRTAKAIATVSDYSAGELARHRISPPGKIFVAANGHEHATRWQPAHSATSRIADARSTVVIIGSPAPHKNAGMIIGMADRLGDAGIRIAVVGAADPRVFNVGSSGGQARNIHWLGRLSDGEMAALMQDCLCLAFPSFEEGFGLPPLEAMASGCPVVVSDRASLPEICADAALYAPPDSDAEWFRCFMDLHTSPRLRREMKARGRARASLFRWKETAGRYLKAMAVVDGLERHGLSFEKPGRAHMPA